MKDVQIERRRQRARQESFEVERLGAAEVYTRFEVISQSGKDYHVTLRDLSAPGANGCSCRDYAVNQLGTCKHIEAVLIELEAAAPSALRRARLTPPPHAHVFLSFGESVRVEARRPARPPAIVRSLIDSHFDHRGRFRGDPVSHFEEFERDLGQLPDAARDAIRIAPEVRDYLTYEGGLRRRATEQRRLSLAVAEGRERLVELREPLLPFQAQGAIFLAYSGHALLADEMGLGKTVQAIAAAMILREREGFRRALIVCPASLKRQWAREIERFTGEPATILEGSDRASLFMNSERFFHVMSYELIQHELPRLVEFDPDLVVLDEAQRIKNWRTRTARAAKDIPRRAAFVLTGAPLESDLDALYSIAQFLDQRLLGPLWRFNEAYFRFDGRGRVVGTKDLDTLKKRLASMYLRRTREEVGAELPELLVNTYAAALSNAARERYEAARRAAVELIEEDARSPLDDAARRALDQQLLSLRESCDDEGSESAKLRELRAVLEEAVITSGHKAIVFAERRELCAAASAMLEQLEVDHAHFHAGLSELERNARLEDFRLRPGCRVFVTTDLGSTGLNLQMADVVINLDQPWSAGRRNQRLGRALRLGRRETLQLIEIIAEDSVEEVVAAVTGVDRALLSRLVELDPTRTPLPLDWELRGRTLGDALRALLLASPKARPSAPARARVRAPKPAAIAPQPANPDAGLFDACPPPPERAEPEGLEARLRAALPEAAAVVVERDQETIIICDDAVAHGAALRAIAGPLVRIVGPPSTQAPRTEDPATRLATRRAQLSCELELGRSLLRAGFPREALARLAEAVRHSLGCGARREPAELLTEALLRGLDLEQAGAQALCLVLAESRSPDLAVVRGLFSALEPLLLAPSPSETTSDQA